MSKLFSRDYDHLEGFGEMSTKSEFCRDGYWASNRKKWWIGTLRNIKGGVYQTQYYCDNVKKSLFSFSCAL